MKVKPFYIETDGMNEAQLESIFHKCKAAGLEFFDKPTSSDRRAYYGICKHGHDLTYYHGVGSFHKDAQEITLDQLDEWLGLDKTETPEEKEAFDSMSKSDSDNIHKPSWAKWSIGDEVTKIKGSSWTGKVVGYYSTSLTSKGYAVESLTEKGSVQIYPEVALRDIETPQQREERERREEAAEMIQCLLDNYSECQESAIDYVLEYLHECDYRKAK